MDLDYAIQILVLMFIGYAMLGHLLNLSLD